MYDNSYEYEYLCLMFLFKYKEMLMGYGLFYLINQLE